MDKLTFKKEWRAWLLIILTIIISIWAYPQLPAIVASHWDFQGQVNGWTSRTVHSILFPSLLAIIYFGFVFMPYIDPKKERYAEFANTYRLLRDAIIFLLFGVFVAATFANLGYNVNIGVVAATLIGFLFITIGNYFGKLKRNWFVGIRTPWSLSSENVWNKTHRFGGRVFIIWGALLILTPWLPYKGAMIILFSGLAMVVVGVYLYSYLAFRAEQKIEKENKKIEE